VNLKRSALALVVVVFSFTIASAEWFEVAGGTGGVQLEVLQGTPDATVLMVTVPGAEMTEVMVEGERFTKIEVPGAPPAPLDYGIRGHNT
jgi:hypothetical protein